MRDSDIAVTAMVEVIRSQGQDIKWIIETLEADTEMLRHISNTLVRAIGRLDAQTTILAHQGEHEKSYEELDSEIQSLYRQQNVLLARYQEWQSSNPTMDQRAAEAMHDFCTRLTAEPIERENQ